MKRIAVIIGVVVGLSGFGAVAARAGNTGGSTHCNDGVPAGQEHDITTAPAHTAYEVVPNYGGDTWVQGCYSTTPKNSGAPEAAGGVVQVARRSNGQLVTSCQGDRTSGSMATVDCRNTVTPTDDGNPATTGTSASASSQLGTVGPLSVGRTGSDVAVPVTSTTTNGSRPGASTATGYGTCAYINGSTPHPSLCPTGANVAGINVATGDVSATPRVNPGGCVTALGNPCFTTAPTGAGAVVAKGDPSNDTVSTTVAGAPVSKDLGDCYGYNMGAC